MKKITLILLVLCVCIGLCACGKSEAAQAVDELIANIGTVTLENEQVILEAEEAVSVLSEKERGQLENIGLLEAARNTYNDLVAEQAAQIDDAILAIGEISLDSGIAISTARNAYDRCSENVQDAVHNYSILTDAEEAFFMLRVATAEELIDAIGTVSLESEESINKAQTFYSELSYKEKEQVSNSAELYDAKNAYYKLEQAEKEKAIEAALAKLKTSYDKVQGITWYEASAQPTYADTRSYVLPYIGKNSGNTWLRLHFHYTGKSWIFFEHVTIVVDGATYYKDFNYYDITRDNDTEVWEIADIEPHSKDIEMLWAIANSTETIVLFEGDSRYYDLTVNSKDKTAIKEVLTAYELMSSK